MGSLETTQLITVLVAVTAAGVLCGFVASTLVQRKRRARRHFAIGFVCGLVAGAMVRRPHGRKALGMARRHLLRI